MKATATENILQSLISEISQVCCQNYPLTSSLLEGQVGQRCSTSQSFISGDAILSKDTNYIRLNFCLDLMLKTSRIFPFDGTMQP